jgi:hypothetical protein
MRRTGDTFGSTELGADPRELKVPKRLLNGFCNPFVSITINDADHLPHASVFDELIVLFQLFSSEQLFSSLHMHDIDNIFLDPVKDATRWNDQLTIRQPTQFRRHSPHSGKFLKPFNFGKDTLHELLCGVRFVQSDVVCDSL